MTTSHLIFTRPETEEEHRTELEVSSHTWGFFISIEGVEDDRTVAPAIMLDNTELAALQELIKRHLEKQA